MSTFTERVICGLGGISGMLTIMTISTTWENKQAIAVHDSKLLDSEKVEVIIDKIISDLGVLSSGFAVMRGDIYRVQSTQKNIGIVSSRNDHKIRCDLEHGSDESERDACYRRFDPSVINYE